MRLLFIILKCIVIITLGACLFIWGLAQGSSHKMPVATNLGFGGTVLFLIIILVVLISLEKRVTKGKPNNDDQEQ